MITLYANGQNLMVASKDVVATDYIDTVYIRILLDDAWASLPNRVAQVTQGKTYNILLGEDGIIKLPNEIQTGVYEISVFAYNESGLRLTTIPAGLMMRKSGFVPDGETPIPPTPDLYAQLLEKINAAGPGGVAFETDETLRLENGILSVNTADAVEQDNTLPVTSAAVHVTVGNIEALLETI